MSISIKSDINGTEIELDTIEKRVESILEISKLARNSDKYLLAKYFDLFHDITSLYGLWRDKTAPSTESIRRCRQKIQARGEYLSDETIQKMREVEQKRFHDYSLF
jgi:hypothetical protein